MPKQHRCPSSEPQSSSLFPFSVPHPSPLLYSSSSSPSSSSSSSAKSKNPLALPSYLATIAMSTTFRPTITRQPSIIDCHICTSMAETKVHDQVGDCAVCLLCDRPYCERHKGEEMDVCEINHNTYYRRHYKPGRIFPSMDNRRKALG